MMVAASESPSEKTCDSKGRPYSPWFMNYLASLNPNTADPERKRFSRPDGTPYRPSLIKELLRLEAKRIREKVRETRHRSNLRAYTAVERRVLLTTGIVGETPDGFPIVRVVKIDIRNGGAKYSLGFLCPWAEPGVNYVHYHGACEGSRFCHCPRFDGKPIILQLAVDL